MLTLYNKQANKDSSVSFFNISCMGIFRTNKIHEFF